MEIGVYMLRYITPSYIVFVFIEILSGALRGIGDVLFPTLITLGDRDAEGPAYGPEYCIKLT